MKSTGHVDLHGLQQAIKCIVYSLLIVNFGFYVWEDVNRASLGHWLYTWDTFLRVAGFAVIEMNVSDWRDEIQSKLAMVTS